MFRLPNGVLSTGKSSRVRKSRQTSAYQQSPGSFDAVTAVIARWAADDTLAGGVLRRTPAF